MLFSAPRKLLLTAREFNIVLLTAVMIFLMFPTALFGMVLPDMGFLAWVHLVPLLVMFQRQPFTRRLIAFLLAQFLGLCCVLYWFYVATKTYGNLNTGTALGAWFLGALFLTPYGAIPLAAASWVKDYNKIPLFVLLPCFMIFQDWSMQSLPFGGVPWVLSAYSQGQWLKFFQWVDHTGTAGLSFYIFLVNALIAEGIIGVTSKKQVDKLVSRLLIVFVLCLVSLYLSFWSSQKFERTKKNVGNIAVSLVQGNISQDSKWDPYRAQENLHHYLNLTNASVKNGAELVLWPETAYPYGFYADKLGKEPFLDLQDFPVPLFFGAVVYERSPRSFRQYNSVLHADTSARIISRYNKMHLVPFGEYLPYKNLFAFMGPLMGEVGTFDAGKGYTVFELNGIRFGTLICFEDLFFTNSLDFARLGADVLVNFTNDAWYADSSALYQHLVLSQFRALENRRPLLRVTNTGLTAVIGPSGEILESLSPFERRYLLHSLKVETAESVYMRHGGVWVFYVLSGALLVFVYTFVKWLTGPVRVVE